jgi:Uma2 family endonuclease
MTGKGFAMNNWLTKTNGGNAMATMLKLGPADHGRVMTYDEFMAGDYQEGYKYELIDGRLYVSPQANLPENRVETWLLLKLALYAISHPEVINYVTPKGRVFVPNRPAETTPEPDLTAYRDFPLDRPIPEVRWEDVSPVLVVEVLSAEDPDKDLQRNVDLYFQVPSIKEYWVLDARDDPEHPMLRVHRRHGKKWRIRDLAGGDTYTTNLLPGLELVLDVRR